MNYQDMIPGQAYLVQVPQGRGYLGYYQRTERGELVLRPAQLLDLPNLIMGVDEAIDMEEARIPVAQIRYVSFPGKIPAW